MDNHCHKLQHDSAVCFGIDCDAFPKGCAWSFHLESVHGFIASTACVSGLAAKTFSQCMEHCGKHKTKRHTKRMSVLAVTSANLMDELQFASALHTTRYGPVSKLLVAQAMIMCTVGHCVRHVVIAVCTIRFKKKSGNACCILFVRTLAYNNNTSQSEHVFFWTMMQIRGQGRFERLWIQWGDTSEMSRCKCVEMWRSIDAAGKIVRLIRIESDCTEETNQLCTQKAFPIGFEPGETHSQIGSSFSSFSQIFEAGFLWMVDAMPTVACAYKSSGQETCVVCGLARHTVHKSFHHMRCANLNQVTIHWHKSTTLLSWAVYQTLGECTATTEIDGSHPHTTLLWLFWWKTCGASCSEVAFCLASLICRSNRCW